MMLVYNGSSGHRHSSSLYYIAKAVAKTDRGLDAGHRG
jgi:hypothetical protein